MNLRCALVALFVVATPLFGQVPQARALAAEGRYDEAKRLLMPLNNDPEALRLLSRIAMAYANDEEAANLCRKAIELQPLNADYHYCAGNALRSAVQHASFFRQPALSKETREELIRAIELDPNHLAARLALLEYYVYAPAFAGGSEEKALQQAAEIRKRDVATGHRAYARIYSRQKKPDLARKEFIDGVREDPKSPRAHTALATFYATEEKNFKATFEELETAIRLDPDYMPAWFRLGHAASLSGMNLTRGEEALRKYAAYRPKDNEPTTAAASYYLGVIFEKEGKKNEARQSYASALKLSPGSKELQEAMKRVR